MNEQEAIARLRRGDIGGLEALVRKYQTRALEAAYITCRDYALSEDIVQAAFLRAYERIEQFDAARPFGPWFLRSVVNDALMLVTRRRTLSLQDEEEAAGELQLQGNDADPCQLLAAAETKEVIWATLDRLTPHQRAAIVLRYYMEMSDSEAAHFLNVPPGTVRRRLHDARHSLRRLLPAWVRLED